jgi:hypothetical protein
MVVATNFSTRSQVQEPLGFQSVQVVNVKFASQSRLWGGVGQSVVATGSAHIRTGKRTRLKKTQLIFSVRFGSFGLVRRSSGRVDGPSHQPTLYE